MSVCVCVCHVVGRFRISTTSESKLDFAVVAVWFVPARTRVVTTKKCTRRFVLLCSERRETGKLFRRGFFSSPRGPKGGESEVGDRRALSSVCVCVCLCVCVCVCVCLCWSSGDSITRTGIRARFSPPTHVKGGHPRASRRRAPPSPRTRPVSAPMRPLDRHRGWGGHREGVFPWVLSREHTQNYG